MERTGPDFSRAAFLRLLGAALPGLAASRALASGQATGADARRRVTTIVQTYDSQGIHRTASPVDSASGDWLRRVVDASGAQAKLARFAVDRVDVRTARLVAGEHTVEGLPFFDAAFTGETGIVGRLGPGGSGADIGVVSLDRADIANDARSLNVLRRQGTHRALVAVTIGERPGLSPSNAASFTAPFGIPVLQVASTHAATMEKLAASGATATLVASATRMPDQAFNVVAEVAGRQGDLPPVVLLTPRSAWWTSTAERSGGLACWTEVIRAAFIARPRRTILFAALSGHETGHLGLLALLAARPDLAERSPAIVCLGANIGAAGGRTRIDASDAPLSLSARKAYTVAGASGVDAGEPHATPPSGEAGVVHERGGRYVAIAGTSAFFRSEQDRWPASVDVDAVAQSAQAVANLVLSLAAS